MKILRVALKLALVSLLFGFRTEGEVRWDISVAEPIIWLEVDAKLFAADGFGNQVDKLKGELGSLKDIPAELQRIEIWKMLLKDFDSIETSFMRLRLKPGQIPEIDALYADTYDEAYAKTHTIKLVVAPSIGLGSGYASPQISGSRIGSCGIVIAPTTLKDPLFFIHILGHELMHCFGINHQQEDIDSIMSYSNNSKSLALEERMALTYMYPLDESYAKETPTLGLSCTPSK